MPLLRREIVEETIHDVTWSVIGLMLRSSLSESL